MYSLHNRESPLVKMQLRSCHSSAQNIPALYHLTLSKTVFFCISCHSPPCPCLSIFAHTRHASSSGSLLRRPPQLLFFLSPTPLLEHSYLQGSFPHHLHFIHLHWASYIKLLTTPKPPFPCPWLTFPQSPHHQLIFNVTLFVCLTFLTSKARSMTVWIQICYLSPPSRRVPGMQQTLRKHLLNE